MAVLSSLLEQNRTVQKPPPPQVGFNNNVKHRGRVFHIQTEDSGVNHPHITTHLFVDGGRIIKSERNDYAELIGKAELTTLLRKRMKEQHKAMFIALRRGQLDHLIDSAFGEGDAEAPSTSQASATSQTPKANGTHIPERPKSMRPVTRSRPPVSFSRPRAPSSLLGIEETERKPRSTPPSSLPSTSSDRVDAGRVGSGRVGSDRVGSDRVGSDRVGSDRASSDRAAAARPALFDRADSASLYGDPKVGEQSLDDVILSYISDDLQAPPDKS